MKMTKMPAIALATLALAAGCSNSAESPATASAEATVAVINGSPINRDVLDLYVKTRHGGKGLDELTPEERKESVEELIRMYAGAEQAQKDQLVVGEKAARIELMRQSAMADLLAQKFLEGKEPTEEQLKAEYDQRIAEMPKSEYKARHILVDEEDKAKSLIEELNKGASFEKLAKENSKDGSAEQGGDLGWFQPSQMVKPFADATQQLEKGKYTLTPVQSQFGWHVIKLEDTRATTPPPYDAVKQQVGQMVRQKQFQDYLKGLVEAAKVERTP